MDGSGQDQHDPQHHPPRGHPRVAEGKGASPEPMSAPSFDCFEPNLFLDLDDCWFGGVVIVGARGSVGGARMPRLASTFDSNSLVDNFLTRLLFLCCWQLTDKKWKNKEPLEKWDEVKKVITKASASGMPPKHPCPRSANAFIHSFFTLCRP